MKRLHINLAVDNLEDSVRFYSALFDSEPGVRKDDYARWLLDDPRVNFAITTRGDAAGIDHLGIQVDDEAELDAVYSRLERAGGPRLDEGDTTCCYARSRKQWITDPQGVAWEAFLTLGESPVYGHERPVADATAARHAAASVEGTGPATPSGACC